MPDQERGESYAQRTESETASSILRKFAEDTTAHAIPRIILNTTIAAKVVWSVLGIAAFVVFCKQTSDLLSNYHTYRTNVELVNTEQAEFPAVTICNFNRMRRSKLTNNSRYSDVLKLENKKFLEGIIGENADYTWLLSSSNDFWPYYVSITETPDTKSQGTGNGDRERREAVFYESISGYRDYSSVLEWENFLDLFDNLGDDFASKILDKIAPTKDELRNMGHQAKNFILQCNFNKAKCDYRNFTTFQNKQYGNCFTFNITQHQQRGKRITNVGSEYGLHMTLFIEKPQYIGLFTEELGARLVIHPTNILPHPEDVGISLTPGFATSIGLRQVELKRLGGKYGVCTHGKSKNHLSSDRYAYSIISCKKKCLLDRMKEKCNCVNNIYDDYANLSNCKDRDSNVTQVRCQQQVERNFHTNKVECDCPVPCHEFIYNTKLSTALWPSEVYQPHLRDKLKAENMTAYRTLEDTSISRENLVRVNIYFEELNYQLVEQVPAHSVAEVLGTIGGLLGLYLGFSALTIFEVVILFYHLTNLAARKTLIKINHD